MKLNEVKRCILELTDLLDLQRNESVVDVDLAANFHHSGDVLVVEPEELIRTVLHVSVVQGDLDRVALHQLHLSSAALSKHHQGMMNFSQSD